jgi:hypothetical protein
LLKAAIAACTVAMAATFAVLAADTAPGRVPTVTRLVKLFMEREDALAAAMSRGDAAAITQTLADDFELRTGARASAPVPRADFLANAERMRPAAHAAGRMAVHDLGSIAIVSFVQGEDARAAIFVVDVWRQEAGDWKLAVRYASPAGAPDFAIPGAGTAEPAIPKKY